MASAPLTTLLPSTSVAPSNIIAILSANQTTLTASEVAGTTGLAVIDGTTLTWREQGITLSNGIAVSLGYNGLVDSTTTALYETVPATTTGNLTLPGGVIPTSSGSGNVTLVTTVLSSGTGVVTSTLVSGSKTVATSGSATATITAMSSGTAGSTSGGGASQSGSGQSSAGSSSTSTSSGLRQMSVGKAAIVLGAVSALLVFV